MKRKHQDENKIPKAKCDSKDSENSSKNTSKDSHKEHGGKKKKRNSSGNDIRKGKCTSDKSEQEI